MILIKPSGVAYEDLTANSFVVVGMDGEVVEPGVGVCDMKKPSTDTASHLEIYRQMPDVGAVIHTHSTYATAWSMTGDALPCILTEMADVFGGPIPCAPCTRIGDNTMGLFASVHMKEFNVPVCLIRQHGVIATGRDLKEAVRNAVYVEHAAKTILKARSLGLQAMGPLPDGAIEENRKRYKESYGQ